MNNPETGLSVVIPCYNESGAIAETVKRLQAALSPLEVKYELIVVDDGSTDGTLEIVSNLPVRVLRNLVNSGYGFSLARGIEAAGYDTIAIIDADLTYHEDDLVKLFEIYRTGFDMCVGVRERENLNSTTFKAALRAIFAKTVSFICGEPVPDANSGLRIFSKALFVKNKALLSKKFSFTTSLTISALFGGAQVGWIPISYLPRHGVTKVRLITDSVRTFMQIMRLVAVFNPLKIFTFFASGVLVMAAGAIGISLYYHLTAGLMLGAELIAVSVLIVSLGLTTAVLQKGFERLLSDKENRS